MRPALAISIALLASSGLAACGDDPKPVEKTVAASDFDDREAGIALRAPAGTTVSPGRKTQVVVLRRGDSTLVISRFERGERLPDSRASYERAARVLPGEYLERDRRQGVRSGQVRAQRASVADLQAVLVRRSATVEGAAQASRHVHFYEFGAEIVVDAVASATDLDQATKLLFEPVLESLKITRPRD